MIEPTEDASLEEAAAVLLAATPPDDSGAETLDRYEWQAMMATVDLLGLYLDSLDDPGQDPQSVVDCGLICEYHEDWVRVVHDEVQLVSGKHKEPSFGAYTTTGSLLGDGGLYHLLDRWLTLGSACGCRLVTTAGLAADAAAIAQAGAHLREHGPQAALPNPAMQAAFDRLYAAVAARRATADVVAPAEPGVNFLPRFLMSLTFQVGEPRRDHLPTLAPAAYAGPVAQALGRPDLALQIWEAVLSLVRRRMRAAGPLRRGLLPTLVAGGPDQLERRTITVADAHVAIETAISTPGAFVPLPRLSITNKMAVKMHEGRCGPTSISRAETLRKRFNTYRRGKRANPGGRESELSLELLLLRVADQATAATRTSSSAPWGAAMWSELEKRLAEEAGSGSATGLDPDMLVGGVADLTNSCKVWFSEFFDAQRRVQELRGGSA